MTTPAGEGTASTRDRVAALMWRLPKVETHVHLEGTLSRERLLTLADRDGVALDPRALAPELAERSFDAFLVSFMARLRALRRPDDWAAALDDLCRRQAQESAVHTEAYITLTAAVRGELDAMDTLSAMAEVAASHRRHGIDVRVVLDAPRPLGPAVCEAFVDIAAADTTGLVVGIGIGGPEAACPNEAFGPAYARAAERGLHRTAHAGEHAGPESVRAAVEVLGAERIGHACTAVDDPDVLSLLRDRDVFVDVCPTSNRATGAWDPSSGPHPLRRLLAAGVRITLGSDDPAVVGGSLTGEWTALVVEHGLRPHACLALTMDAVDACFLGPGERARLRARVAAGVLDLREEAAAVEEALG